MNLFGAFQRFRVRQYFDEKYYLSCNPDVARSGVDPFEHFCSYGWREGRNPSHLFVTLFYRDKHGLAPDVNPLADYARIGSRKGLVTKPSTFAEYIELQATIIRPHFSEHHYKTQVGQIETDCVQHYLEHGWKTNKWPTPDFDPLEYVSVHSHIAVLGISPFYHYISIKKHEYIDHVDEVKLTLFQQVRMARDAKVPRSEVAGKTLSEAGMLSHMHQIISAEFDRDYYLSHNEDVRSANKDPLDHFILYGWRERRSPNRLFDCAYYLDCNPAVKAEGVNPFYHYLTVGRKKGLRPNPVGMNFYDCCTAPHDEKWDHVSSKSATDDAQCVIIMPVYRGYQETLASIHAVLSSIQATKFALYVVNDCSPDPDLVKTLTALSKKQLFAWETNETNIGFVRSVNRALRRFPDKDVILLNTDAIVVHDWLDRMTAHARRNPKIATVTPFSNNATIFSYPVPNNNNAIEMEIDAAGLDRAASICNAGRAAGMPVGVGFCLLITAASRASVGILDEKAFGRGYGEENDFCLRAAKAGFRNVLAEDVFVYHVGEVSFGKADRAKSAPGQKALIAKHPEWPEILAQHIETDPSETGRIRLDLFRMAKDAGADAAVHVYHALTGGIVTHVQQEERDLLKSGRTVIHLRVGVSNAWSVEIRSGSRSAPFCPNLRPMSFNQFKSVIQDFFGWLSPAVVHIHSLVGFDWRSTKNLMAFIRASGIPYRYTLHDYSVVCHRNDLLRPNGRYCGLPDVETCRSCVLDDRTYPEAIDPATRRETFENFLGGAESVIAPSSDIRTRLQAAGARYPIEVITHKEEETRDIVRISPPKDRTIINIVTIGAIGRHKGSRVILSLARDVIARDLPMRYHIVGYSDRPFEMEAAEVIETGRYATIDEAYARVAAADPSCIFLPSIWPETYSFTLSMAFALQCPPVVFDLGAQAERVRERGFGLVLPYSLIDEIRSLNDRLLNYARTLDP